eukprot:GHVN01050432.1.p1 GENE.GHVN01050432.1~~GHVN01050432.1.p1  ORF type:complete len:222 (+),score=34.44 GHVN01050432.1:315-980(+)
MYCVHIADLDEDSLFVRSPLRHSPRLWHTAPRPHPSHSHHSLHSAHSLIYRSLFVIQYIIRAGTAGSLMPSIKQGDLVVVQGAVRDDGPTALHAPPGYPAIADLDMCVTLREQAKKHKDTRVVTGLTLTSDVFYKPAAMPWTVDLYSKFNVECVEMEISALFIVARSRGIKAAAIVCIDGSPLGWRDGDYDPTGNAVSVGKGAMLKISLESAKEIADKHKE